MSPSQTMRLLAATPARHEAGGGGGQSIGGDAGTASAAPERQQASIRYIDQADMAETFADSITGLMFDGQKLRIEFGVTRFDEVKPNTQITGRRYPACRLVLPPAAAVELIKRMQQIAAVLTQAGVVKTTPRAAPERAKS